MSFCLPQLQTKTLQKQHQKNFFVFHHAFFLGLIVDSQLCWCKTDLLILGAGKMRRCQKQSPFAQACKVLHLPCSWQHNFLAEVMQYLLHALWWLWLLWGSLLAHSGARETECRTWATSFTLLTKHIHKSSIFHTYQRRIQNYLKLMPCNKPSIVSF